MEDALGGHHAALPHTQRHAECRAEGCPLPSGGVQGGRPVPAHLQSLAGWGGCQICCGLQGRVPAAVRLGSCPSLLHPG